MAKKAPVAQSRAVAGVIVGRAVKPVGERSAERVNDFDTPGLVI